MFSSAAQINPALCNCTSIPSVSAQDIWGAILYYFMIWKYSQVGYENILTIFSVDWHWMLTSAVKIARTGLWSDSLHSPRLYCLCFSPFPNHIILSHLHNQYTTNCNFIYKIINLLVLFHLCYEITYQAGVRFFSFFPFWLLQP